MNQEPAAAWSGGWREKRRPDLLGSNRPGDTTVELIKTMSRAWVALFRRGQFFKGLGLIASDSAQCTPRGGAPLPEMRSVVKAEARYAFTP